MVVPVCVKPYSHEKQETHDMPSRYKDWLRQAQ